VRVLDGMAGSRLRSSLMICICCANSMSGEARFCGRCGRPCWEAWAFTVWPDYDYGKYDWAGRLTSEGPIRSTWAETLEALKDYEVRVLLGRGIDSDQAIEVLTDIVSALSDERIREERRSSLPPGRPGG